jgi:6-pyruvoyltetrahydropterin/6-carboxytetrahydropterin synthase
MDFGGLKAFKDWAEYMFDHTLVVAEDDPLLSTFENLNSIDGGYQNLGICDLRVVPAVGCEGFAKLAYDNMAKILEELKQENKGRYPVGESVKLVSVEVFEHAANSALYGE